MSNSAARFTFAPLVKNNRFSVLSVDSAIRDFQDMDYVQCCGCGAYHDDADLSLHGECQDCYEFRHSDDFYSINKKDKALNKFSLTFSEANKLRCHPICSQRAELIQDHADGTSTWRTVKIAS